MIENSIEYKEKENAPDEVVDLIDSAFEEETIGFDDLNKKDIYAIVNRTEQSIYISLGYYLPNEAEILGTDTVFAQEFRIRLTQSENEWREQILYDSVPIDPYKRMGSEEGFVPIDETMYKEFYDALRDDGLFEWEETERVILAD